jgi:hypothetical protein
MAKFKVVFTHEEKGYTMGYMYIYARDQEEADKIVEGFYNGSTHTYLANLEGE